MASVFTDFGEGYNEFSGPRLAAALTPVAPPENPGRLRSFYAVSDGANLYSDIRYAFFQANGLRLQKQEQNAWIEIFSAYWKAVGELLKFEHAAGQGSWDRVFEAWKEMVNMVVRGYSNAGIQAWTIPCLYVVGNYLRTFAIRADAEVSSQDSVMFNGRFQEDINPEDAKTAKLEETTRVINRMFTLCLSDRAPLEESRKWGIYNSINLLFKTYFRLNSVGLCKNLLRALNASSADLPSLEAFPKSHIVTFEYYVGVIHFLDEDYTEAEKHLARAWKLCHKDALKNRELILTYLIPCHIVTTHTLPSESLLAPFPRLQRQFQSLCHCIRKGDLGNFDAAMSAGEDEFVKRRIYLPLERGRDIALRNLFRKVFIAGGFEQPKEDQTPIRRTRIPVAEFAAAVRIGTHADDRSRVDMDEVECLLSSLIYKGLMKGYIARERGMVVLSKGGSAFPGTGL